MQELATSAEVARYLKVRPNTLDRWSCDGRGPRFIRINGRRRYDWADVRAWAQGSPSESRPNWTCRACKRPAMTGACLIVSIDHAVLNGRADWEVLHHGCEGPHLPNPYTIEIERADTWQKLAGWTAHLWEKEWIHSTNLHHLLRSAGAR